MSSVPRDQLVKSRCLLRIEHVVFRIPHRQDLSAMPTSKLISRVAAPDDRYVETRLRFHTLVSPFISRPLSAYCYPIYLPPNLRALVESESYRCSRPRPQQNQHQSIKPTAQVTKDVTKDVTKAVTKSVTQGC